MRLPDNAIGISDILAYRECPRRFAFQMRRHTEGGEPPGDQPLHPGTRYGTVVHDGIAWIEDEMLTDDEAVERCFEKHGAWLEPEDADRLRKDFETYRDRDEGAGVITVASEREIKVPLLHDYPCPQCKGSGLDPIRQADSVNEPCSVCEGKGRTTFYFRARIDRLYQSVVNPAVFVHRDYKSSKWRRSEEEVHNDKQMWAYNCGIYRYWPECEELTQWYDQLRYGDIPTRKTEEQRTQMWEWLQKQVKAILADDSLEPTHNEFCPWCPVLESCSEVRRLSEWSIARIEALSGGEILEDGDERDIEDYVEDLELIGRARKMAERYEESVKGTLRKLPTSRLEELGYRKQARSATTWRPEALQALYETYGDDFFMFVNITQSRLDGLVGKETKKAIMDLSDKVGGTEALVKKKAET